MQSKRNPIVGNWYQRLDKGQEFTVVAFDEDARLVEMQHFDGDLEEMDLDTWYQLEILPIEEPENWSGPFDVGEIDDLTGTEVTDTPPEDWNEPLDEIAKHRDLPPEEYSEQEAKNEWGEGRIREEALEQEAVFEPQTESEEEPL